MEYAARIASLLPAPLESVYFVNSGAEAVEGALKLAKRFTRRTEIVSMRRAYHGSTHGAMSMMGAPEGEEWKGAFRPLLPDVQAVEFNDFSELERITRRTGLCAGRAGAGRGRRPSAPSGLSGSAAQTLRRSRRAADFRRDTDRHGPHGPPVRHAEIRRHARHRLSGQGLRRGHAPSGRSSRVTR